VGACRAYATSMIDSRSSPHFIHNFMHQESSRDTTFTLTTTPTHRNKRPGIMPSLTATYTSPTVRSSTPHVFSASLPALSSTPSTQDRVTHLAALQSSLKTLQKDVNAFLTQKMVEDKADIDAQDEETYGEEVVEED
jgi:hypothetical protein